MGKFSAKAQKLSSPITSFKRMQMNADKQKIYFYCRKKKCYGYLKTGQRKLFVSTEFGDIKEINPLCLLDFYVSEEVQRQGVGKRLFDLMLQDSGAKPEKIAYDRPSEKLLKFLSKHFSLKRYLPQNNNFVVFSKYFTSFGGAKSKVLTEETQKECEDDTKSVYESKPSYRVTYNKGGKKHYDETSNVVNRDYINNLITGSHSSNEKIHRMAANEESKNGFNQMLNKSKNDAQVSTKVNSSGLDLSHNGQSSFENRAPLGDNTNMDKRKAACRNPIIGEYNQTDTKQKSVKPKYDVKMEEDGNVPTGPELDDLINRKEAELQQVLERLSVTSQGSTRKEQYEKTAPRKSDFKSYQPPVAVSKTDESVPTHGHASLAQYNHRDGAYTANGMRRAQFHSTAPWATE